MAVLGSNLKKLRWSAVILGISNVIIITIGTMLIAIAYPDCRYKDLLPFIVIVLVSGVRIAAMIRTAIAQRATAMMIVGSPSETPVVDALIRHERRIRYKRWLWWTRFAMLITVMQFLGATYLLFDVSFQGQTSNNCILAVYTLYRANSPNVACTALKVKNGEPQVHLILPIAVFTLTSGELLLNGLVKRLVSYSSKWHQNMLGIFIIVVWLVVLVQCFTGYDVLRWRSFYNTHDDAWKNHYREVFDHGIREALCCLGRVKYMTVLDEDEVCSVAQLLGDLVAYRASGTGHLEFFTDLPLVKYQGFNWDNDKSLGHVVCDFMGHRVSGASFGLCVILCSGLALLQRHRESSNQHEETIEAPEERIQWASAFHPFAEAAYTGLLLDFGRNPIIFICSWLYRQGILTPWTRKRLPSLKGDNWWQGHAAAFLKYVNLPAEVLRHGRVNQAKCEAAYFIVVLHDLKSIVISVRGTETPEDLITDGLCKACILTTEDIDGLINDNRIMPGSLHHGHTGIVEAARDLYMQIEGNPDIDGSSSESGGKLSSLLGPGCECEGYNLQIVGHSLGGAIAAMLGVRLYRRYPKLHVYTYGPLPCVDLDIANACSEFVTSIVYHNEFSARLSVASLLRLQAAAMTALSEDAAADSITITKLASRFLSSSNLLQNFPKCKHSDSRSGSRANEDVVTNHCINGGLSTTPRAGRREEVSFFVDTEESSQDGDFDESLGLFMNPFAESSANVTSSEDPVSQFMDTVPSSKDESSGNFPEMFLPGLLIHIVPQKRSYDTPLWKRWSGQEYYYRAYIANREAFKDIVVSPSMFIDHLPWRCRHAMEKVLEMRKLQAMMDESQMA